MDIHQMRYVIGRAYPGDAWKKKVANMPADQIVAIYYKFAAEGRFAKSYNPVPKQLTIEECEASPWTINGEVSAKFEQLSFL